MGEEVNFTAYYLLAKEVINRTLKEYAQADIGQKAELRMEIICASYPYTLWAKFLSLRVRDLQEEILSRLNRLDAGERLETVILT